MLYIIDKKQVKEVIATNRNIDKLRKKGFIQFAKCLVALLQFSN